MRVFHREYVIACAIFMLPAAVGIVGAVGMRVVGALSGRDGPPPGVNGQDGPPPLSADEQKRLSEAESARVRAGTALAAEEQAAQRAEGRVRDWAKSCPVVSKESNASERSTKTCRRCDLTTLFREPLDDGLKALKADPVRFDLLLMRCGLLPAEEMASNPLICTTTGGGILDRLKATVGPDDAG